MRLATVENECYELRYNSDDMIRADLDDRLVVLEKAIATQYNHDCTPPVKDRYSMDVSRPLCSGRFTISSDTSIGPFSQSIVCR